MNYWMTLIFAVILTGCSALPAQHAETSHLYLLDAKPVLNAMPHKSPKTIAVSLPNARPGFDTPRMAYLIRPFELKYFAIHRWVDSPAHMLKPLLAQALEPGFDTVVTGGIPATLRLDTELVGLQQDFTTRPSRIQLTLRAQLVDVKEKRVIAEKLFDESESASSDDPYGGAVAANHALQRLLARLTVFCIDASNSQ